MYVCYCRANVVSQEYELAVTLVRFMYGYNIMHTAGMELRCLLTRYDSYLPSLTHLGYWALRHRAMAPINYRLDATDLVPKLYQTGTTRVTRDREKYTGRHIILQRSTPAPPPSYSPALPAHQNKHHRNHTPGQQKGHAALTRPNTPTQSPAHQN
jgi:hypothetical protein